MISKESREWKLMIEKFESARKKSNKYSICIYCWTVFSYKIKKRHIEKMPNHFLLTSKYFTTEKKFIELAQTYGKYLKREGEELFLNPFRKIAKSVKIVLISSLQNIEDRKNSLNNNKTNIEIIHHYLNQRERKSLIKNSI